MISALLQQNIIPDWLLARQFVLAYAHISHHPHHHYPSDPLLANQGWRAPRVENQWWMSEIKVE